MDDYTNIDLAGLVEQCARLPGQMAYIGTQYADAELAYARMKLSLKQVESLLYNQYKHQLEVGGKRTTEAAISAAMVLDPSYTNAYESLFLAEAEVTKAKAMLDALRAKKDMLVSICATRRAEAETWR